MKTSTVLPLVFFGMILIANFFYWSRVIRWYGIRKSFPLDDTNTEQEKLQLYYGNANVCGHYMRNAVFSGATKAGIVIRKPFPFSLLMPPILIPWSGIERIHLVSSLEGAPVSKLIQGMSSPEYARIVLKSFKDCFIVIPWLAGYRSNLPGELACE